MSVYLQNPLDDNNEPQRRIAPALTGVVFAAAGVLYLLTGHPLLAGILPWLYGGWPTFSAGLWILRTDPVRSRARVCFLFYLAAACWKAAATALATVMIFMFMSSICGIPPNNRELMAALLALLVGLVLNTLIGGIAVVAALVCKVRVWIRTNLRGLLRNDLTRAAYIGPSPQTRLSLEFAVVATAVLVPLVILGALLMVAMMALDGAFDGQPVQMSTVEIVFAVIGTLITLLSPQWV
jgi:hypothetical protein